MKKVPRIFNLLLVLVLFYSCKKEYPVQLIQSNPEFQFNGSINGNPILLQAGINNNYMFTSYALDGNGVYDFTGELKDASCTSNCTNALKIFIKDYRQYSVQPTTIDSSIVPAYYSFSSGAGTPSSYSVQFYDSMYNGTAQSYLWDFGDGSTSVQHRPVHIYSHPGVYASVFNNLSTSSCSSFLNNDVVIGQAGGLIQISFNAVAGGNSVNLSTTSGGGAPPYSYSWDFGDGNSITTTSPTWNYMYSGPGVYLIKLIRTDAAGTVQTCNRNFATQTATSCYSNCYPSAITPVANPMNLSDVTIEWRDATGTLYSTQTNVQPAASKFKIISVENYSNNISGQPTKKIHAAITCTLYNGMNSIILSGDIVFSIAHL